jgi:hypothetical protein
MMTKLYWGRNEGNFVSPKKKREKNKSTSVLTKESSIQASIFKVFINQQMHVRGVWLEELKFNKHCSTFVLFDKKISNLGLIRLNRFVS